MRVCVPVFVCTCARLRVRICVRACVRVSKCVYKKLFDTILTPLKSLIINEVAINEVAITPQLISKQSIKITNPIMEMLITLEKNNN